MFGTLNGNLPDVPGTLDHHQWPVGPDRRRFENATNWFVGGMNNENTLGATANLYVLTNSSTSNLGTPDLLGALDVVLTALGELHAVTVNAVPLPPALLLLGSAFAGLAGVARRRQPSPEAAQA